MLMIIILRIIFKYANDHYADDHYADDHYAGNNADDLYYDDLPSRCMSSSEKHSKVRTVFFPPPELPI